MNIAISGASGLLGKALQNYFQNKHSITPIPRNVLLHDKNNLIKILNTSDVVINLNGASILKILTRANKKLIYDSRIISTRNLVKAIEECEKKPRIFISTSAVGIYDYSQKAIQNEYNNKIGNSFLAKVCIDWENEAKEVEKSGTRLIILRLGVVISKDALIVKKLKPFFKVGLGATLLPSDAPFPFIHIDDYCSAVEFVINNENLSGVFNLVANSYETNETFARSFAEVLKKPVFLKVPSKLIGAFLGNGGEALIKNARVEPLRLIENSFMFKYPTLYSALEKELKG